MDLPPSFMCKIFILLTFALHVWANVCIFFYPCCLQETVRIEQNPWWINSENEAMLHSPLSFAFKLKMMNTLESREKWLVLFRIQKPSPSLSLEDIHGPASPCHASHCLSSSQFSLDTCYFFSLCSLAFLSPVCGRCPAHILQCL